MGVGMGEGGGINNTGRTYCALSCVRFTDLVHSGLSLSILNTCFFLPSPFLSSLFSFCCSNFSFYDWRVVYVSEL